MAFKPSLREVLSSEAHAPARAALQADPASGTAMPWYLRVLAGGGAWFASLFLLAFLALFVGSLASNGPTAIVLGLVLTGLALWLRRESSHVFMTQFTLSLGLAGQAFCIAGMGMMVKESVPVFLTALVLQIGVFWLATDLLQRFLSTVFASLSLLYLVRETLPPVAADLVLIGIAVLVHRLFLRQGPLQGHPQGERVVPAAFGLVSTLFFTLLMRVWFHDVYADLFRNNGWQPPPGVLTLGFAGVTLYSAWRVMEETQARPSGAAGVTVFAALALTALLTVRTPGIIAAVGVLMLGFHRRSTVLLGMAVAFLLTFGVSYYYDLELTLLAKSLALLGSGLLMLGLRLFVSRRFPLTGVSS